MKTKLRPLAGIASAGLAFVAATTLASTAVAAPVAVAVGTDYAMTPYTFNYGDSSFTFSGTGDWFGPTAIATGGTGAVNVIFGSPTSYFVNRGTVTFGSNDQYAPFASATPISFSNGDNFIGLRATKGADTFYGYAFTTDSVLNGYAFESVPGRTITASTALAAVPEPASWAMMLGGFGLVGGALRSRRAAKVRLA